MLQNQKKKKKDNERNWDDSLAPTCSFLSATFDDEFEHEMVYDSCSSLFYNLWPSGKKCGKFFFFCFFFYELLRINKIQTNRYNLNYNQNARFLDLILGFYFAFITSVSKQKCLWVFFHNSQTCRFHFLQPQCNNQPRIYPLPSMNAILFSARRFCNRVIS